MPKNMYKCEKCGEIYDDWNKCYTCEQSHIEIYENVSVNCKTIKPLRLVPWFKSRELWPNGLNLVYTSSKGDSEVLLRYHLTTVISNSTNNRLIQLVKEAEKASEDENS